MSRGVAMWPERIPPKLLAATAAVAALVLLLLYLQGSIGGHKVAPGTVPLAAAPGARPPGTAVVERRQVADLVEWPGTVGSRSVANVAAKVTARVHEVRVRAGAAVRAGEVVAVLDDREVRARAEQARAALTAAVAQATQAEADQRRVRTLLAKQAATQQDFDAATARAKSARAQVGQARDALAEAEVLLGETAVRAPFDGVVAARLVDPGDLAVPGRPIVVIHDPHALRLEAHVSERCAGPIVVGMAVVVHLDSVDREITTQVEEVQPMADPQSRTVQVRATLPADLGVRPGMFGSLRTPCGSHAALLVPAAAVVRAGQLESVRLLEDGELRWRNVRTGKPYGERVEVLSGLREGETVWLGE